VSLDSLNNSRRARHTHLDRLQRESLARLFAHQSYPRDAVVLHRGATSDVAFVVSRGTVQISTKNEWGQTTLVDLGEGDVFGEEIVLGGIESGYEATALADSELILLDRSDIDELSAQAPVVFIEIMKRAIVCLRTISGSLQNQSRQTTEIPLLATPSFEVGAARFLAYRGGSLSAMALFVAALGGWLYIGSHGIHFHLLHVQAFDPSPFRVLGLTLKVIAAVWAATILMVLSRIPRRTESRTQSRLKLLESLKLVEGPRGRPPARIRAVFT
jgi:CRP-like cAMP-binding protein